MRVIRKIQFSYNPFDGFSLGQLPFTFCEQPVQHQLLNGFSGRLPAKPIQASYAQNLVKAKLKISQSNIIQMILPGDKFTQMLFD